MANNRDVAKEIRDEYVDTMSKVLFSYFKSYSNRLNKLQFDEVATREDLMGLDDSVPRGVGGFFGKTAPRNKASVFTMGDRGDVLGDLLEAPIMVPHAQQRNDAKVSRFKLDCALEVYPKQIIYSFRSRSCFAANSTA